MVDFDALTRANQDSRITQRELKEKLTYSPETGEFRWLVTSSNRAVAGASAGAPSEGYVTIQIDGRQYRAHRLAWLYMTGEWPNGQVDHKDRCRSNNAWINLREATNAQNSYNSTAKASNKFGLKGVYFEPRTNRYTAQIRHGGKRYTLGAFDTPQEAHQAYVKKAIDLHGEFARAS